MDLQVVNRDPKPAHDDLPHVSFHSTFPISFSTSSHIHNSITHTHVLSVQPCQKPPEQQTRVHPSAVGVTMPYVAKAQWVERLSALGEEAPVSWTVAQIRARIAEIEETNPPTEKTTLEARLKELRRQSTKKKSEFTDYLKVLGVATTTNDTVAQMVAKGERFITESVEPSGSETLGFGKFSAKTMQEVVEDYGSYVAWCQTTMMEDKDHSWRLRRFVTYATQKKAMGSSKISGNFAGTTSTTRANTKSLKPILETHNTATADGFSQAPMNCEKTPPNMSKGSIREMTNTAIADGFPNATKAFEQETQMSQSSDGGYSMVTEAVSQPGQSSEPSVLDEAVLLRREVATLREEKRDLEMQMARVKGRKEM